jgi:four helix bundle protein
MELVSALYDATEAFPKRETYSLADQIRRTAVSVPSNIAEGQAHHSERDFRRFLRDSRGSLAELETQNNNCPAPELSHSLAGKRSYPANRRNKSHFKRAHSLYRTPYSRISHLTLRRAIHPLATRYSLLSCCSSHRNSFSSKKNNPAPTNTSNAIFMAGSLLTSGTRSEAAT